MTKLTERKLQWERTVAVAGRVHPNTRAILEALATQHGLKGVSVAVSLVLEAYAKKQLPNLPEVKLP